MSVVEEIYRAFIKEYEREPLLVRSPGRINLIGEHTDYNEGFVLPASVDRMIVIAAARREDGLCRFYAHDLEDYFQCHLHDIHRSDKVWSNYILGVMDQLVDMDLPLGGIDCVFGGDIPIAAGMSSSAAIECGFAFALDILFELSLDRMEIVRISQRAENEFVGVQCGIMDQFTNMFGKENYMIRLDCRSLAYEYIPFDHEQLKIVLCDTGVRRPLTGSDYNRIREQCQEAVEILQRFDRKLHSLRDVSFEFLEQHRDALDPLIYERCRYVVGENMRVLSFCKTLKKGDFEAAGELMFDSHSGLRDEYGVSCEELDRLVDIVRDIEGVYGSRLMGAGFGGCTINLVKETSVSHMIHLVKMRYREQTGTTPEVYVCQPAGGTSFIKRPK